MSTPLYKPSPGYALRSTRRHPREPETVVIGQDDCDAAKFVGEHQLDDTTYYAYRHGRKYYFQLPTAAVALPYKAFCEADVDYGGLFANRDELHYDPPAWLAAGLTETATGYGARLNSGLKIHFEGRLRRIYFTQYSNAGTAWFLFDGRKIFVR